MKSYFAKLAARATIANIPVAPSRFPGSPDPFEAVAPEFGSSPPTIPQPSGVRDDSREQSAGKPVLKTEDPISEDVVRVDPGRTHERETRSQPLPRLQQPAETLSTAFEIPPPREALSQAREHTPDSRLHREREPTQPARSENRITTSIAPKLSLDSTEVSRESGGVEQLEEIQREQSMLLRKADAFMSALLERRSETANPSIDRQADLEIPPSKAEPSHAQIPTRLQPPAYAVRAHDDRDDRPSLVIGKLTVEVMPPPAPPVAPSSQVVIVREGRSGRGASRNSIQRFGLGQF
jgi:hypothetical protein